MPLPPEVLRAISPQTFEVYKQSLPGWPERVPYAELASTEQGARSRQQSAKGEEQGAGSTEQGASQLSRVQASQLSDGHQSSVTGQVVDVNPQSPIENLKPKIQNSKGSISSQLPAPSSLLPPTWLPLSISTGLTKIDLLKFIAFAALFFLIWRYPFEEQFEDFGFRNSDSEFFVLSPEQRFLRSIVITVVGTGLLVAAFGFIERFAWNGDILLFVAGYEAGAPAVNTVARASGPFINPDHFANYLSLIFPLALGCALFRTFMVSKDQQYGLKIFCGFTTFLLFTGILLSLSRGAWISTLLAISIFAWLSPWQGAGSRERGSSRSPHASRLTPHGLRRVARLSAVTVCILLIVSLFFAGSSGREQVDLRLSETIEQQGGLGGRTIILKDAFGMLADFPLLGVGLGAWPELFLRYRSGPWSPKFFREAHNDYLEVFAETGLIGFGLLTGFFLVAGKRLVSGLRKASSKYLPLIAGILAALGGMIVHEWLDFSLQIPANAFLFTVLLAIGMRMAGSREQRAGSKFELRNSDFEIFPEAAGEPILPHWSDVESEKIRNPHSKIRNSDSMLHALSSMLAGASRFTAFQPAIVAVAAAVLIAIALRQDQGSYPYNFKEMTSLAEAQELLLQHPTHGPYHWELLTLAGKDAPLEWQLEQANAAVWNEPANPYYRDLHAWVLMTMERTEEGLREMTQSVAESPSLQTHVYLSPENILSLSEEEQAAVEDGFKQARARSYPEAANGLADFYAKLDRFADQAALYEEAALKETDNQKKVSLLMNAGHAYLKAGSREQGAGSKTVKGKGLGMRGDSKNATNAINAKDASNAMNAERDNATNATSPTPAPDASRLTPHGVSAERAFRGAIAASPTDPKPYQQLVTAVYAVRRDLDGARELVADGIKSGAPLLPLYLSLAEAAHKSGSPDEAKAALKSARAEVEKSIKNGESPYASYIAFADGARSAGDREQETAALLKALELQPRSPDVLSRLAGVYFDSQNFDRAALYLNRVAKINPDSPDLHYRLALAEEGRYRFADASRAYARALELAPKNASYRERYEEFKARVEVNRVSSREHGAGSRE